MDSECGIVGFLHISKEYHTGLKPVQQITLLVEKELDFSVIRNSEMKTTVLF